MALGGPAAAVDESAKNSSNRAHHVQFELYVMVRAGETMGFLQSMLVQSIERFAHSSSEPASRILRRVKTASTVRAASGKHRTKLARAM